ncbi:MAG: cell surface protein SprA [Bacteroidota bacterium]
MRATDRRSASPLRHLARLAALAAVGFALLLIRAGSLEAGDSDERLILPGAVRADTDSVAIEPDDLALGILRDTTEADSTGADSTARARYLLPALPRESYSASPVTRVRPSLLGGTIRARTQSVVLDSALLQYRVRETVGNADIRAPIDVSLEEYLEAQLRANREDGFRQLLGTRIQREQRRAGVGINLDIPGGNQSAFRTLFGKNEVDLRVTGNSTLDIGAGYDQNALQQARTGNDGSFAPDFGQELNLNVAGTIGDKLRINVNYDTQSQFDFENQVSLVYTGYEDDIIQTIEAGNVFLQTPSELIRGGQRLFGLRTDLQFGPLSVTGVASQQDAESEEVVIEGGSQATEFSLVPTRYEDDTHFFLGFAFYNWWDAAHRDPTNPTSPPGLGRITGLEVWVQDPLANNPSSTTDESVFGTALVDLGEQVEVLDGGRTYLDLVGEAAPLPNPAIDQYDDAAIDRLRNQSADVTYSTEFGLSEGEFKTGRWRKLREGVDYIYDDRLGWLSLTGSLGPNDALAVTYQYRTIEEQVVTVGDFASPSTSGEQSGPRTLFKLLRDNSPIPADAPWDLTMRNIYRVGGRSLNPQDFSVQVTYEQPGNTPQKTLPGVQISDGFTLLQALGLDRTDEAGLPRPDDVIDFRPGYTVDAQNGRIIFPMREPFGRYMEGLLRDGRFISGTELGITISGGFQSVESDLVFSDLYSLKADVAERELNKLRRYAIEGEYKSASQSVFNVGFGLVENSVTVTSGGVTLVEGSDYIVNETAGTVEIRNPIYLAPGQQIRVEVERNRLFAIGSKTLVGLRSDYRISENAGFGATWMRLAERPLTDKFRIGEEALQNSVAGLDGGFTYEPRWMTRLLDALPLIQTRAPSSFQVRGEIARFSPGHPETFAFRQVQRDLNSIGRSLTDDEIQGISSIDDFEGAENINSALEQAPGWKLAATPRGAGPPDVVPYSPDLSVADPRLATNWRGLLGWYSITTRAYETLNDRLGSLPLAASPVLPQELFPGRDFSAQERSQPVTLFDVYFDPTRRGPYNYNRELSSTYANDPTTAWGGMIRGLDAAFADFGGANTVESIEFLFAPLGGPDGTDPIADGAVMYIDLGVLNEDTIPNGALNTEDGLAEADPDENNIDGFGRLTDGQANANVDIYEATRRTEDVGLDGLPSTRDLVGAGGTPYSISEGDLPGVQEFLNSLPQGPERERALRDPAADDYHNFQEDAYFSNNGLFPGGATAQERYAHYFAGTELNNDIARREILPDGENGISQIPSTEDINNNFSSTRGTEERFFRYEIPLDAAGLQNSPYFTGSTIEAAGATYYLIRIPVRAETRIDESGDLSNVEMVRVWTTGHQRPATLRFATFELVGSQWQKSRDVGITDAKRSGGTEPELFIASINTDENPRQYLTPVSALRPVSRDVSGQIRDAREQSLVFRVEDLSEGQTRALYKPFTTQRLDLTKYSNLRMYVHGEGFEVEDSMRVFLRLGSDETENYYEIEQPLYPAASEGIVDVFGNGDEFIDPTAASDYLWQTRACPGGDDPDGDGPGTLATCDEGARLDLNSINILLSELNQLKVTRDLQGADISTRFQGTSTPEGAAPGARLSIVGTPSIQSISTVVLGVRNADGGQAVPHESIELWFNELRVTGYDEEGGTSGFVTAQAQLADVANANARISFSQDGFGGLGGGLGERDFVDRVGFTLATTFNAHKLVPERFGWNVPVALSIQENEQTPRFDPTNSDIRIDDLTARALSDETIPEAQRQISADSIRSAAQTVSSQRTIRVPISKSGSRSPWLKYTLDGINLSYTNTTSESTSPRQLLNESDAWRVDANYRLQVPRPRTVRPFWWTNGIPLVGSALGGVQLNLLPRSLSFTANTGRTVTISRERPRAADLSEPDLVNDFLYPRRTTHDFGHARSFNIQYEPLSFLTATYGANSTQSLDVAGVDERFQLLVRDTMGVFGERGRIERFDLPREAALAPGSALWEAFGVTEAGQLDSLQILGGTTAQLDVLPWAEALGSTLGGYRRLLTERYDQSLTSTFRISTRRVKWLSWIQPDPIGLSASYAWDFQPITGFEDRTIAGVGSSVNLQTGIRLRPKEFWRLFPFYRSLEEADQRARQESDRRRRDAEAERRRRQEAADDAELLGETGEEAPVDITQATEAEQEEPDRRPLIDIAGIGRRLALAITGLDDVRVTYRGSFVSSANGIQGDGFSLLAGLTGNAPPLAYRLGLDRRLPIDTRLADSSATFQLQDVLGEDHQLEGRTTIQLSQDLRVSLSATTNWDRNETFPIERTPFGLDEQSPILRGSGQSTVFGIGGTYEGLLDRHEARYRADVAAEPNADGSFTSATGSASGLAADFAETFAQGSGTFGPDALFRLPLPSWEVSWSGLNRWPLLNRLTQSVTLQHSYFASNETQYASFDALGDRFRVIGGTSLLAPVTEVEPTAQVVNERFQPLLGVRVGWKAGFQTEFTWNQSRVLTLQPASATLTQKEVEDLQANISFSKAGFRLPFFRRLRNTLRLTLTASISDDRTRIRYVLDDLEDRLNDNPVELPAGQRFERISFWPRIGYQVSNRVNMDVFFRYEQSLNQGTTGSPRIATYDGGVTLRISFSN